MYRRTHGATASNFNTNLFQAHTKCFRAPQSVNKKPNGLLLWKIFLSTAPYPGFSLFPPPLSFSIFTLYYIVSWHNTAKEWFTPVGKPQKQATISITKLHYLSSKMKTFFVHEWEKKACLKTYQGHLQYMRWSNILHLDKISTDLKYEKLKYQTIQYNTMVNYSTDPGHTHTVHDGRNKNCI